MTATSFGSIAASFLGATVPATATAGQRKEKPFTDPVRKRSFHENSRAAKPWQRWGKSRVEWNRYKSAALGAFDRLMLDQRKRGAAARREKVEQSVRLRGDDRLILAFLLDRYNHVTGQLYPAIQTIVSETGLGRTFVIEGLDRLKRFGFVNWVRRTKTKPDAEGQAGPQLEQTSSAYFFDWQALVQRARKTFYQLLTIGLRKVRPTSAPAPVPAQRWPSDPEARALLERMQSSLDSASTPNGLYP